MTVDWQFVTAIRFTLTFQQIDLLWDFNLSGIQFSKFRSLSGMWFLDLSGFRRRASRHVPESE
jgi:hypothetical protein